MPVPTDDRYNTHDTVPTTRELTTSPHQLRHSNNHGNQYEPFQNSPQTSNIDDEKQHNTDYAEMDSKSGEKEVEFNCMICLDTVKLPVVTDCGHLYCWACIHQWMLTPTGNSCPTCKADVSHQHITPIYVTNSKNAKEAPLPANIPPRPQRTRTDNNSRFRTQQHFMPFNFGINFSFGVGPSPNGFFESAFNIHRENDEHQRTNQGTTPTSNRPVFHNFLVSSLQWSVIFFVIYMLCS